jgi:hypothetical protein
MNEEVFVHIADARIFCERKIGAALRSELRCTNADAGAVAYFADTIGDVDQIP